MIKSFTGHCHKLKAKDNTNSGTVQKQIWLSHLGFYEVAAQIMFARQNTSLELHGHMPVLVYDAVPTHSREPAGGATLLKRTLARARLGVV